MKKTILLFMSLICFLSFCSCRSTPPARYFPGEQQGDENYIWVSAEPFAFVLPTEGEAVIGSVFYNEIKTSILIGPDFCEFPEYRDSLGKEERLLDETLFFVRSDYYRDYFDLEVNGDTSNIFGKSLPKMRFEKMTKEEFVEKYPSIDIEEWGELAKSFFIANSRAREKIPCPVSHIKNNHTLLSVVIGGR